MPKSHLPASFGSRNTVVGLVFIVLFAAIGVYLLTTSHAATPYASVSATSGTLGCNASTQTDSSGNQYVKFGSGTSCGGGGSTSGPQAGGPGNQMIVGVDTSGWPNVFQQLSSNGIHYIRTSSGYAPGDINTISSQGDSVQIATVIFGTGGSISSLAADGGVSYANSIVSYYEQHGLKGGLAVEILNEPGGSWFWSDPTNYSGYVTLAKAVHDAFNTAITKGQLSASSRPAELCSWDGGQTGSVSFGQNIQKLGITQYCDGVTVHPYGGSSGQFGGASGDQDKVEEAHAESGLPVYITEVGWPTDTGAASTGDSQQWTQAQQATNITNFVSWARSTNYVYMVISFNYQDYTPNDYYGITDMNGNIKPAYNALAKAANP